MKHSEALAKIHSAIYQDIDLIINSQSKTKTQLDEDSAKKLIEYGKFLRTDKDESNDVSNLSDDELNKLIQDELKKVDKK